MSNRYFDKIAHNISEKRKQVHYLTNFALTVPHVVKNFVAFYTSRSLSTLMKRSNPGTYIEPDEYEN
jgi:hypothetical protein